VNRWPDIINISSMHSFYACHKTKAQEAITDDESICG